MVQVGQKVIALARGDEYILSEGARPTVGDLVGIEPLKNRTWVVSDVYPAGYIPDEEEEVIIVYPPDEAPYIEFVMPPDDFPITVASGPDIRSCQQYARRLLYEGDVYFNGYGHVWISGSNTEPAPYRIDDYIAIEIITPEGQVNGFTGQPNYGVHTFPAQELSVGFSMGTNHVRVWTCDQFGAVTGPEAAIYLWADHNWDQ